MSRKTLLHTIVLAVFATLALTACQPETVVEQVEVTRVITETVIEEGQSVEVTRVVTEQVEVEVTRETVQIAAADPTGASKVLRINIGTYPDIIDPQLSSFANEIGHLQLIYEGLTKLDAGLETVPGAAESWEYNEDATELTFTLREGLKYSDGSILNAMRFRDALLRNINPATAGEYAAITDEVLGAAEWRIGTEEVSVQGEEVVKASVQALDMSGNACEDYEQEDCRIFRINLSKPAPYFHTVMSLWVTYPAKAELITEGGPNWWNSSKYHVGNGPYVLQSLEPFVRGNFVPNEFYWDGVGNLDIEFSYLTDTAVAFQAYRNDEFDIIILAAEDLATVKVDPVLSTEAVIFPGSCTFDLEFHQLKEPFNDRKVRQAFAMALDREAWVRDVYKGLGTPTLTFIPPGYPGYQEGETRWAYDPEAALQAIAESSYGSVENLPPIIDTFGDTPRNRVRHEWLVAKWNEVLGVDIELNPVEPTTYTALTKDIETAPQMYILGWCADYPDPQNWLSVYFRSTGFVQDIGYSNPEFDALVDQADTTVDPEVRMELYRQAQDLLVEDSPVVFMRNNVNSYLVKPWVTGIVTTPQDSIWPGAIDPIGIDIDESLMP
ncbi:MAG TPA: peptide ABC transporter substrate-binding protein [candidate division Zixibacteria bacterium]|nr:peptide ABC transporter substrate-binding protein [candidate division Zixibacteria bacterium]